MRRKNNITNVLRAVAREYEDEEDEIDSVFITVLNGDGSIRMIPFDADERSFDNSAKTICYLGNGLLKDAEMIGLASELAYVKKYDEDSFEKFIELLEKRTEFNEFETLFELIEEMENGNSNLNFSRDSEKDTDDNSSEIVQ